MHSHAATAFASGLFTWYWIRTADFGSAESTKPARANKQKIPSTDGAILRWTTLGVLAGLASCVRTQEVLLVIAPVWEWTRRFKREPEARLLLCKSGAMMLGGFLIGFSPQAIIWKLLYGSFLAAPSSFNLAWSNFALGPTLFSSYHGMLTWTPLYVLALTGLVWQARCARPSPTARCPVRGAPAC